MKLGQTRIENSTPYHMEVTISPVEVPRRMSGSRSSPPHIFTFLSPPVSKKKATPPVNVTAQLQHFSFPSEDSDSSDVEDVDVDDYLYSDEDTSEEECDRGASRGHIASERLGAASYAAKYLPILSEEKHEQELEEKSPAGTITPTHSNTATLGASIDPRSKHMTFWVASEENTLSPRCQLQSPRPPQLVGVQSSLFNCMPTEESLTYTRPLDKGPQVEENPVDNGNYNKKCTPRFAFMNKVNPLDKKSPDGTPCASPANQLRTQLRVSAQRKSATAFSNALRPRPRTAYSRPLLSPSPTAPRAPPPSPSPCPPFTPAYILQAPLLSPRGVSPSSHSPLYSSTGYTPQASSSPRSHDSSSICGEMMKKTSGNYFNRWRRRHFCLVKNTLFWTKDKDSVNRPLGYLKLDKISTSAVSLSDSGGEICLEIKTKTKLWQLKTVVSGTYANSKAKTSGTELQRWFDVLQTVIKRCAEYPGDPATLVPSPSSASAISLTATPVAATAFQAPVVITPSNCQTLSPALVFPIVQTMPHPLNSPSVPASLTASLYPAPTTMPDLQSVNCLTRFVKGDWFTKVKYKRRHQRWIRISEDGNFVLWGLKPDIPPKGFLHLRSVYHVLVSTDISEVSVANGEIFSSQDDQTATTDSQPKKFSFTLLSEGISLNLECSNYQQYSDWLNFFFSHTPDSHL